MGYIDPRPARQVESPAHFSPYADQTRGGCLTIFLIFIILMAFIHLFLTFIAISEAEHIVPSREREFQSMILCLTMPKFIPLICAIGLWQYKFWAYYGMIAGYLLIILIDFYTGSTVQALFDIATISVLYALVKPVYHLLD